MYRQLLYPFLLSFSTLGFAQPDPGHSHFGGAFDQGPRTFAKLVPGQANINFQPELCSAAATSFINQGISQLHGFLNYESERSFRHAAWLDNQCVAAYWGIAMANTVWVQNKDRAEELIKEARKRLTSQHGERTRLYIEAIEAITTPGEGPTVYAEKLRTIFQKFSWDLDAKAFYVMEVWSRRLYQQMGYLGADVEMQKEPIFALAKEVLAVNPAHPIHHYIVHMWDNPVNFSKALNSADLIGFSAPGIAHMWHMGGHIYSQANFPFETWWSQEASARVDHRYMQRQQIFPFALHNHAHNNEWLTRTLMKMGDFNKAWKIALNLLAQPAHPTLNKPEDYQHFRTGAERVLDIIERGAYWRHGDKLIGSPLINCQRYATYKSLLQNCERLRELTNLHNGRQVNLARITHPDFRQEVAFAVQTASGTSAGHFQSLSALPHLQSQWGLYSLVRYAMESKQVSTSLLQKLVAEDEKNVLFGLRAALGYAMLGELILAQETLDNIRPYSEKLDLNAPEVDDLVHGLAQYGIDINTQWISAFTGWRPIHRKRPKLAKFGPLLWQPMLGANFNFVDKNNQTFNFYRLAANQPTLLVFVLNECQHCDEQVKLIEDRRQEFSARGVNLVFVTSQPQNFAAFRQYRAYDDFESFPLHGLFLLDKDKTILWEDISAEAFRDIDFVLKESDRLLHPLHRFALLGNYHNIAP